MSEPSPKLVEICNACELPWAAHKSQALRRMEDDYLVPVDEYWPPDDPRIEVTWEDCVYLLKRQHDGPPGPQGPMGAQGVRGATGKSGMQPHVHSMQGGGGAMTAREQEVGEA